jgi:hypothetical protein
MTTDSPRIVELAKIISDSVAVMQSALIAKNHLSPSFDEDAVTSLPLDLADVQDRILDASAELHDLLLQPINLITKYGGVSAQ